MIRGALNHQYQTIQADMFESGLAAQIGVSAVVVWLAIKQHADYNTGESFPGVRRLMAVCGLASKTTQNALDTLLAAHLLRIDRWKGRKPIYVARERLDVRVGERAICTVVVDYVPSQMRERVLKLQAAAAGKLEAADIWAEVDVLPGPGFTWDPERKALRGRVRADEVPAGEVLPPTEKPAVLAARERLQSLALEMSAKKPPRNSQRRPIV